ncbi:NPCBM/NEW2 domain-containing protein [Streptomyces enissocaesilis]|uniref:Glycosyl hydrolase family 98 putative carbohydrate-binding module domain-containing protein n=1 Tax=Streptomyces enissocaesilis TaxID=332589 RepID=A0ABP6K175_9ACTN
MVLRAAVLGLPLPGAACALAATSSVGTVIGSARLSAAVAQDFPRALSRPDRAGGARLPGGTEPVTGVTPNGKAYAVEGEGGEPAAGSAAYTLLPALEGVETEAEPPVTGRATTFVDGAVCARGLGAAPPGRTHPHPGGKCASRTAQVGREDSRGTRGNVRFAVAADGVERVKPPVLRAAGHARPSTPDMAGAKHVDLLTGGGGDGPGNDRADWGNARFHRAD